MNMAYAPADEQSESGGSFMSHLPAIARQRKWWLILPAIFGLIAGVLAAFLLPVKYQSRAVLLVEASLLPEDVADVSESGVVDQRMARIRQQVLSRPQLIELIQRNDLYSSELQSKSLSEVIEKMRESIAIEPVTAEIQQAGAGGKSTIAFALSYLYSDPIKTQAVAQALTEQVLQIDAAKSAETAANTVQFLTDQSSGLELQIKQLETQISTIKAQNGIVLASGSMSMMGMSGGSADAQIAMLQQANAQLNAQRDMTKTSAERDPIVAQAEAALAAAQATYSDTHPDVIIAKQRLAEAKNLAKTTASRLPVNTIDSQIASNNRQIALLQAARAQENARVSTAINAQARAPAVMEQIAQLQSKLDGLNAQYQAVSGRLLAARAGKKAEDEQQAERLSVIDPPVIPEEPKWPNRPLLIAGGLAAGLALGLMLAALLELIYRPIRDVRAVEAATGETPLVVIPTISPTDAPRQGLLARLGFGRKGDDDDDDDED